MALILLIVIGGVLGWLGSIATRVEDRTGILRLMGAGISGALLAGLLTNQGSVLGGLRLEALIAASAAAVAALLAMYAWQRRQNPG